MRKENFSDLVDHIKACGFECDFFGPGKVGGYRCEQDPDELANLILLLREKGDQRIYLEIGSASGGTMRHIHEQVGFKKALSIDHGQWQAEHFPTNVYEFRDKVERYILDSHTDAARDVFNTFMQDPTPATIFIDGDHSFEGVVQDIHSYAMKARRGDVLIFHDVFCDKVPGVAQAVQMYLAGLVSFEAQPEKIHFFRNNQAKNKLGILCLEF